MSTTATEHAHEHAHAHGHSHGNGSCQSEQTSSCQSTQTESPPATLPIVLTEKAAGEVKRIIHDQQQASSVPDKIYLRLRVVGGGCSGFQNKLDLDPVVNPKLDDTFEMHGVPIVIDRRSLMYLNGVTVDFHDEINRRGFSIVNPNAKTTCGCGSSYSM